MQISQPVALCHGALEVELPSKLQQPPTQNRRRLQPRRTVGGNDGLRVPGVERVVQLHVGLHARWSDAEGFREAQVNLVEAIVKQGARARKLDRAGPDGNYGN